MKKNIQRLTALMLSIMAMMLSLVTPATIAAELRKASKMTWYVSAATVAPGSTAKIDIVVYNCVALKSVKNLGLKVDGPIVPSDMSATCPTYNASITHKISGNTIMFDMVGSNPSTAANKSVLFSVYFNVPAGCPDGKYNITWQSGDMMASTTTGAAYFPLLKNGYINVSGSAVKQTTTTKAATTTTTTKTTTMTTTVTTTETLPNVVSKAAEIKINNLPEKVTYEVGEPLDLKGGTYSAEAKVLYSNGAQPSNKKDNVSMTAKDQYVYIDYNYAMAHWGHIFNLAVDTSAVNMNKAGTYPVYVKAVDNDDDKLVYDSKSFNINVNETTTTTTIAKLADADLSIRIDKVPDKTIYYQLGEKLDLTGLEFTYTITG
ncbi:MAG: hypothetical protein II656_05560, partial [Ruminococcus sp.]|nr:hypothetical protein [Ruminococcus sp.]